MQRQPEPELMTDPAQAAAYANADFEAPHSRVIDLFRPAFPDWPGTGHVLDLGCGPGDIALRFARAYPHCQIDGIDGAAAMLEAGRPQLNQHPDLAARIHLHHIRLPDQSPPRPAYDAVISNSLLHHLHDPTVLWNAVAAYARPNAPIFVVDLMRPADPETAAALTDQYCVGEPDVLRHDFYHSLLAAFTPAEVTQQLQAAGLAHLHVETISDRHLLIRGTR
jgi:SAM-dependent methyltransferase